jgi:hypothetical protein
MENYRKNGEFRKEKKITPNSHSLGAQKQVL